jgi:hypothetical protein
MYLGSMTTYRYSPYTGKYEPIPDQFGQAPRHRKAPPAEPFDTPRAAWGLWQYAALLVWSAVCVLIGLVL